MIYLASPYSHPDPAVRERRFKAACRAAGALIAQGHAVFSPIAHSHPIAVEGQLDAVDNDLWLRINAEMMEACSEVSVLMLPGWMESTGIAREIALANERGLRVEFINPDVLTALSAPLYTRGRKNKLPSSQNNDQTR